MVCCVIGIFEVLSRLVSLVLESGLCGFLLLIRCWIMVWMVVLEVFLLLLVLMFEVKNDCSVKVLWGVWMYLCVMVWEMVDLCRFSLLVILCSVSGCRVCLLNFRKVVCCCSR